MADIEVRRVHDLGLKGARAAADHMADRLGRKFGLTGEWHGNVLSFERPGVTGSLAVSDKDLRLSVSLGLLLQAMKASIEAAIVHEIDSLFTAARPPAPPKAKKAPAARKRGG